MHLPVDQREDSHAEDTDVTPDRVERQLPDARAAGVSSGRRSEAARWIISFVIVAACHGVGALALVRNISETSDAGVDTPVVMLDLPEGLAPAPPKDLPPGPLMEDYVQPTPLPKEETKPPDTEAEVEPPKLEPEPPKPPEPPAEVALPKPEPEPPKPPEPPAVEMLPSAPAPARTPPKAVVRWQSQLRAHIERFMRYPAAARRGGTATVSFTIDRQGHLVRSSIVQSAGSAALDQEALAMLVRAQPLPHPPNEATDDELTIVGPVHFDDR